MKMRSKIHVKSSGDKFGHYQRHADCSELENEHCKKDSSTDYVGLNLLVRREIFYG